MIPASRIVEEARALVGTPWRHQHCTPWAVDCIGMVRLAASRAGIDYVSMTGAGREHMRYARAASPKLIEFVGQWCARISEPEPGCLVVWQECTDPHPRHVGIYTQAGTVIHAQWKRGVVESGYRASLVRQTHSLWRLPGVEYAP